ncbi:uncharacterized protein LACBIDRAFT_293458 [Laccaria bicolor S238N-H82]|uniref:Uncharacterized protein n=1 Tax=Laccaria bicolor (strain S238N-H82 / ATCC MYA-4686) TaxID=486041 RepID=B0D3P5_LACBS|nr:uncharacterized protein LACBIDRAFT_293458 [Laccaria bicolor S238N-H82]EDR10962.1 hypothetical protein LACBIDRAFT_293458 [Laccaria bicolor S238N-H82]|eukprot:XP_001878263.1 hypothetical protein LACBIDRAFT_293458 [Laccaria bicolor S238N-H82]
MPDSLLAGQVRSVLEGAPDALPISEFLGNVDEFVLECSSSPEPEVLLFHLEEEFQKIFHEVTDYSSLYQTEIFLAILYHLDPVLPSISVISWFDLLLRPALREPKLPTIAVTHAKELIIGALQKTQSGYSEMVGDFRRRLLELYLLDAFNESSGDDAVEWAEIGEEEREKRTRWKVNLEDILVKYGSEQPEDLLTEVDHHFATPSSRLQLLMFLNAYTSSPSFPDCASIFAQHPIMQQLIYSLYLDYSSTVCTAGMTLMVKLLPVFAIHAATTLKPILPKLLAILARIMCWRERPPSDPQLPEEEAAGVDFDREILKETSPILHIRSDLEWERLEMTFNTTISFPPSPRPYFTTLYYLYPSNVLKFLRNPAQYLDDASVRSPYTVAWAEALEEDEIRRRSENLLREHCCHPLLIWRDSVAELLQPEFWVRYDISRIVSEAAMLDIRNLASGLREKYSHARTTEKGVTQGDLPIDRPIKAGSPRYIPLIDFSSERVVLSLQDMIQASVALKSDIDVEVVKTTSQWSQHFFTAETSELIRTRPSSPTSEQNQTHVAQAISRLQRDRLLLLNELNFELWLSRENAKHIARLYQDRILMKTAETERQGLYNKLRKYRAQVISLEKELQEHKRLASSAKNKYVDWNAELQKKLKELRDEKKNWVSEEATLRRAEKETQARFAAQGKLLGEATNKVFQLQTQKKENQHKIDRLKDYEQQIEQHVKIQRLWDEDFHKFNERGQEAEIMKSQYRQMEIRLESLERTQAEMDDNARVYRRKIMTLEAQLVEERRISTPRHSPALEITNFASEKAALLSANKKAKDENSKLKDEVEELREMVELLKGKCSGQKGIIY